MAFSCPEPDFVIRCLPEDISFGVKRDKLAEGSHVFADMFSCCDRDCPEPESKSADVYESASTFAILLRLLHDPPADYPVTNRKERGFPKYAIINPESAIPFPILPVLYDLVDKYAVSPQVLQALNSNLQAYSSTFPLKVYGLATRMSLDSIADEASAFLIQPPLHTYTSEEVKIIPTAEAYHKLLTLQHYREEKIRDILAHEQLFPHGYGVCNTHKETALNSWGRKKKSLLTSGRIDAGTDVAAEMADLKDTYDPCPTCQKAFVAATEMLAYKCRKVPRRISKISQNPDL